MIVIHAKKLVVLLPWKTASQTLTARLGHLDQLDLGPFYHFNPALKTFVHQHMILSQYLATTEAARRCRIAVFIRNLYDRLYSGFLQLLRDICNQPRFSYPANWIRDMVLRQLQYLAAMAAKTEWYVNQWFDQLPAAFILFGGYNLSLPLHSCSYWTHSVRARVADFIGKVESFEADFQRLCEDFDLDPSGSASINVSANVIRELDVNGYQYAAHLTDETIGKINLLFRDDFDLLGYKVLRDPTSCWMPSSC